MEEMGNSVAPGPAETVLGSRLMRGSSGRWAAERFLAAAKAGRQLTSGVLRTNDVLRRDEWVIIDTGIQEEALIRLQGVADLMARGLTRPIANALGKTVLQYGRDTFMDPATVSMDGITRTENDRVEFDYASLPLPITHKDWYLNIRSLMASRSGTGEPLDTTYSRKAARVVFEMLEQMLFQGGKTFGQLPIYGYTTHPNRNTVAFGAGGNWNLTTKTGDQYLADLLAMITLAQADRAFGPYMLYIPADVSVRLDSNFTTTYPSTIRERLLAVNGLLGITTVDQLPSGNVVLVQMVPDVVQWLDGEQPQTVQWDVEGGFHINFKCWAIGVPLVKADISGRSGIVHMA